MNIGLYDMDMVQYHHVLPNLEIMKLGQYYKTRYIITKFTTDFTPTKYTKFIIRKDYNDHNFPKEIFAPNIELGGYAFSGGLYRPLDEEIEKCVPNIELYIPHIDKFSDHNHNKKLYQSLLNSNHLRLSLDNEHIWPAYESQIDYDKRGVYMVYHDYNLNKVQDARMIINEHLKLKKINRIAVKFPIQIENEQELLNWSNLPVLDSCFGLQYNGIMKDELFHDYIVNPNLHTGYSPLVYNVTEGCPSQEVFISQWLPKLHKQLIFAHMNHSKVTLKYDEHFFTNKDWIKVLEMFQLYLTFKFSYKYTEQELFILRETSSMFAFAQSLYDFRTMYIPFTKGDVRRIFMFVKDNQYELFNDFYQIASVKLQGDEFVDDTPGNSSAGMRFESNHKREPRYRNIYPKQKSL